MITKNEIKELRELARSSAFREQNSKCVVEGIRSVKGALLAGGKLKRLLVTDELQSEFTEIDNSIKDVVDTSAIEKIATTKSPQGVVGIFELPLQDVDRVKCNQKILVLDQVSDPGNLGTIIRSCVAFNIRALILVGGCDPYNPKVIRSSAGSVFGLDVYQSFEYELPDLLKEFDIFSADIASENDISILDNQKGKVAVVLGSESDGIRTEFFDNNATSFSINMADLCESLNVAMTASIVAHELNRNN